MGAWGTALYSDDTACQVRDSYIENLKHGKSDKEAYQSILNAYGDLLADREVACLVYFALADTAWKYGRLHQTIKAQALALIEDGGDVFVWERDSPKDAIARKRAIRSLEERLRSEQPEPKVVKITKPKPKKIRTTAPSGSVFLLHLPSGYMAALVLVGFLDLGKSIDPIFSVLNWRGERTPTETELHEGQRETLLFQSGLGEMAHVGIVTKDERKSVMANLVATDQVIASTMPFDSERTVFFFVEGIAGRIDEHFTGQNL
jgi:hypothetical protein